MKIGRIIGVVLSIALIIIVAYFYNNEDPEWLTSKTIAYASENKNNNTINNNIDLTNNDMADVKVIEYENPLNYQVELKSGSVVLDCKGQEDDINIVKRNMSITAKFAKTKDGFKENTIVLGKNEKVYIYLYSVYNGDAPSSEITCNYNLDIAVA